jgi:hypothetical protein
VALTEVRVDAGGLDDVAEGDVELTSPPAEAQPLCDQQQQHRQQQREQHEQQHQREQQRQRDAAARAAAASPAPESVADGAGARGGEQGAEASRAANAVAAKTFSALVRKYAALSEEEEAAQLKLAGKFGKGETLLHQLCSRCRVAREEWTQCGHCTGHALDTSNLQMAHAQTHAHLNPSFMTLTATPAPSLPCQVCLRTAAATRAPPV